MHGMELGDKLRDKLTEHSCQMELNCVCKMHIVATQIDSSESICALDERRCAKQAPTNNIIGVATAAVEISATCTTAAEHYSGNLSTIPFRD